jgi:diadenosine tetraphosphate (Ap4A) HIT family hydrolase
VEWPASFYALRRGEGCPFCAEGRPEETPRAARFFAGEVVDAYLQREDVQRGYAVAIWRGRHVAEPTELAPEEAAAFWLEVVLVGSLLEQRFAPVKTNYEILGNTLPHLHAHVVPRYADDPRPGLPFPFPEGERPPQDEAQFRADVEALRALARYAETA